MAVNPENRGLIYGNLQKENCFQEMTGTFADVEMGEKKKKQTPKNQNLAYLIFSFFCNQKMKETVVKTQTVHNLSQKLLSSSCLAI